MSTELTFRPITVMQLVQNYFVVIGADVKTLLGNNPTYSQRESIQSMSSLLQGLKSDSFLAQLPTPCDVAVASKGFCTTKVYGLWEFCRETASQQKRCNIQQIDLRLNQYSFRAYKVNNH